MLNKAFLPIVILLQKESFQVTQNTYTPPKRVIPSNAKTTTTINKSRIKLTIDAMLANIDVFKFFNDPHNLKLTSI